MTLSREARRHALAPWRADDYSMDAWSVTMGHMFGIAGVLYAAGEPTPYRWQYSHGCNDSDPIRDYHAADAPCTVNSWPRCEEWCTEYHQCCECTEEREYVPFLDAGELGIEMLTYAGNVLNRYASLLERAGRSY